MFRKYMHYTSFLLCLLLCMAMPFLMLLVEQQLELRLDATGQVPCTVRYRANGETVVEDRAYLTIKENMAVIVTASGETVTVPAEDLIDVPSPPGLLTPATLTAIAATALVGLLMVVVLIPLNAYLIQFSIVHTPDGRFRPFDAA